MAISLTFDFQWGRAGEGAESESQLEAITPQQTLQWGRGCSADIQGIDANPKTSICLLRGLGRYIFGLKYAWRLRHSRLMEPARPKLREFLRVGGNPWAAFFYLPEDEVEPPQVAVAEQRISVIPLSTPSPEVMKEDTAP